MDGARGPRTIRPHVGASNIHAGNAARVPSVQMQWKTSSPWLLTSRVCTSSSVPYAGCQR